MSGSGGPFGNENMKVRSILLGVMMFGIAVGVFSWLQTPYYGGVPRGLPKPRYSLSTFPRGKELVAKDGVISDPECAGELVAVIDWKGERAWNGKGEPMPMESVESYRKHTFPPFDAATIIFMPKSKHRWHLDADRIFENPERAGRFNGYGYPSFYTSEQRIKSDISEIVFTTDSFMSDEQVIGYAPFQKEVEVAGVTIRSHSLTGVGSKLLGRNVEATVSTFGISKEKGIMLELAQPRGVFADNKTIIQSFSLSENLRWKPSGEILSAQNFMPRHVTFRGTPYWEVRATTIHTLRFPIKLQR